MVMENEIRLGDIMDKLTPGDRVVIYNAARQVVYRGYAANAVHGTLNPQRRIKKMGLGMETYRATEQMWDWEKTDSLPEQVPVEQCTGCGTYWNMRDLRLDFEAIQQRLIKAATEG